jgi:hypothetical protein
VKSPRSLLNVYALALLWSSTCALPMIGCAGHQPSLKIYEIDELKDALSDWRGERTGLLWLRRDAQLTLELPTNPGKSRAHLTVSGVLTRLGSAAPGAESFTFLTSSRAESPRCTTRRRGSEVSEVSEAVAQESVPTDSLPASRVDPGQRAFRLPLPALEVGEMIEVHCTSSSTGPQGSGALWLGASGAPAAESMVQVRAPETARVAMRVSGGSWRPLTLPSDGQNVLAVRAERLAAREGAPAHVRWALRGASPRGFDQRWLQTWSDATTREKGSLSDSQGPPRAGIALPFKVGNLTGNQAARASFIWVRDRLQPSEAARDGVAPARGLLGPIETNTLSATDKVHLLKWMLDVLKVPAQFALARPTAHPAIDGDFPTLGALQTPLLRVTLPTGESWLDPSCSSCKPGEVRSALRGGQVLLLPASPDGPRLLTNSPWPLPADSSTSAPQ